MVRYIVAALAIFISVFLITLLIEWIPSSVFSSYLKVITSYIEKETYDTALATLNKMKGFWKKRRFFIGLENSFEKIEAIELGLLKTEFFLKNRKKESALLEIQQLKYHWNEIGE